MEQVVAKHDQLKPHQFKPGQSGNPSGRAKGIVTLSKMMRQNLTMEVEVKVFGKKKKMTLAQAIALNQQLKAAGLGDEKSSAARADTPAAHFVADRTEGKVKEIVELQNQSIMPGKTDEEIAVMLLNKGKQTRKKPPGPRKKKRGRGK